MTDVFISYARADRDRIRLIAHGLTAEGFSVWWDPDIKPGKKWNAVIRRSLDTAAAVVTCWTPKAAKSDWVLAETSHGHERKALVPVMARNCTPPIPYNMIQSVDLTRWRGKADDRNWLELLRQVRALVEAKRRLAAAVPPPGEAEGAEARGGDPARYVRSTSRGRMGPRLSSLAVGAVVAGALLTAGLWSFANMPDLFAPPAPPYVESAIPAETAAPTEISSPAPGAEPPAVTAPVPEAAPEPAPATESAPAPPIAPEPAPQPTTGFDPVRVTSALDACAQRLAMQCPAARGRTPVGFSADRRISDDEAAFLRAGSILSRPPTEDAVSSCRALLAEPGAALARACRAIGWPASPAQSTPTTADPRPPVQPQPESRPAWADFITDILRNVQVQQTPAPATAAPPTPAAQTQPQPGATRPPIAYRDNAVAAERAKAQENQEPVIR